MLRVGSLFSGAGLCDLGFQQAGFKHQFFCEIDPFCRAVLARHWPGVPIYDDIRDLDPGSLPASDVLTGGFPCQDVSCAGGRAGITTKTRSGLWSEYARIIKEMRPRYAVIENVKGLLSNGMEIVLQDLSAIGYDAEWQSIPAALFGAPHLRERIFIVAYADNNSNKGIFRFLHTAERNLGEMLKLGSNSAWQGIQIDRTRKEAILQAYCGPKLCRVDDGRTDGLDEPGRGELGRADILAIDMQTYKTWLPWLKALGNGITPQQAYFVACCILEAEGLTAPKNCASKK
jgi:DNA (cytosine-5)-methyltransferase 1